MRYRRLIPCLLSVALAGGCATEARTKPPQVTHAKAPPADKARPVAEPSPAAEAPPVAGPPPAANAPPVGQAQPLANPRQAQNAPPVASPPPAANPPPATKAPTVAEPPPAGKAPPGSNPSQVVYTKDVATPAQIRTVQATVKRHLRDPEGARFGKIYAMKGSNGTRYYCGFLKEKDNFGNDIEYAMFHLNRKYYLIMSDDLLWRISIPNMCEPHVEAGESLAEWLTNVMGK
jgi:hypothetical protein